MKKFSSILLMLIAVIAFSASAQLTSWDPFRANQEVGYAGIGNQNELLVTVCYNQETAGTLTVNYNLFGSYSDGSAFKLEDYVSQVKIYARKREPDFQYHAGTDKDKIYPDKEISFTKPYDYRDPVNNSSAKLLASTTDLKATSLTSVISLSPGDYLIYLAVDIKKIDVNTLPFLTDKFTQIGGKITKIGGNVIDNYVHSANHARKITYDKGSKIIVPGFQMLYRPDDLYSKYYRIPSIATTAEGSLVAMSDARKFHIHDLNNNIDILTRRSINNGKTWSDPITIMQGSLAEDKNAHCKNAKGYGDASVATFKNGNVLVCAIAENGVNSYRDEGDIYTYNKYRFSRDNGRTWGPMKEINPIYYGGTSTTNKAQQYKYRGCIAPGQFRVAQLGALQGMAVCCLRTTRQTSNKNGAADHQGNYVLYYDPQTDQWNSIKNKESIYERVNVGNRWNPRYEDRFKGIPAETASNDDLFIEGNNEDESQIIEVGENLFLISLRSSAGGSRTFKLMTVAKVEDKGKTAVYCEKITDFGNGGMNLQNPCNGGIMRYRTNNGEVLLHTVPKGVYIGDNCRTSLSIYSAELPDKDSQSMSWKFRRNLSDWMDDGNTPESSNGFTGGLAEAAQYSSITEQQDGTIAILFEGNPIIIRQGGKETDSRHCSSWGDWVMAQYYLNLRIGDIIPGATPAVKERIAPPAIAPRSGTYSSKSTEIKPEIVISQDQSTSIGSNVAVATVYSFDWYDENGEIVNSTKYQNLDNGELKTSYSKTFTWQEVAAALSIPAEITSGCSLKVSAFCTDMVNSSVTVSKIYRFMYPIRQVRVVTLPTTEAAKISVNTEGQIVFDDEILTVTEGEEVHINGPAINPYKFLGYYYREKGRTEAEEVKLDQKITVTPENTDGYQIVFVMPDKKVLPDNDEVDGKPILTIYARYAVECGFQTRVNSNFNAGKEFVYRTDYEYKEDDCPTFYSYWSSDGATGVDHVSILKTKMSNTDNCTKWLNNGETESENFSLAVPEAKVNTSYDGSQPDGPAGTLVYSDNIYDTDDRGVGKRPFRLDAYPTILPDVNTATNFNAVVLCKVGEKYLTDENGRIVYYLVNGYNHPYLGTSNLYTNAAGVSNWWNLDEHKNLVPRCVGLYQDTHSGMKQDVFYRPLDPDGNIPWLMENGEYVLDVWGFKKPDLNRTNKMTVNVEGAMNFYDIQESFPQGKFPKVLVEFYVINNSVTDIDVFVQSNNYVFKVMHPITYDQGYTSVGEVKKDAGKSNMRITNFDGGVQFSGTEPDVKIFNMMGILVKSFRLDGVQYVALPQGVYIANGQKFIVR